MGRDWCLLGLYYEKYNPIFSPLGIQILEGYFNTKTRKCKLVRRGKIKLATIFEQEDLIKEMESIGYRHKCHFLVDVADVNIKLHDASS